VLDAWRTVATECGSVFEAAQTVYYAPAYLWDCKPPEYIFAKRVLQRYLKMTWPNN
jgi:hypothetical protein